MAVVERVGGVTGAVVVAAALVASLHAGAGAGGGSPAPADAGPATWDSRAIAAAAVAAADAASHWVDPDPIPIAAPFEVTNTATQAFAQLIPSPQAIVFQPGGTRAGNVYTTVAQLDQVAQTLTGPFDLVCDTTVSSPCTLSGALTLSRWANWTCLQPPGASAATWTIAAGTTIVNPPASVSCNVTSNATAAVTSTTTAFSMVLNARVAATAGGAIWSSTAAITIDATGPRAVTTSNPVWISSTAIAVYAGAASSIASGSVSSPSTTTTSDGVQSVAVSGTTLTLGGTAQNPILAVNVGAVLDAGVSSVTAANGTVTIGGTPQNPTIAVNIAGLDGGAAGVTWGSDLLGSNNVAQWVGAISGPGATGGTIPVNANSLQWARGVPGGLSQQSNFTDVPTNPMTISSQPPYSGATVNTAPGNIVLNEPAPAGSGTNGKIVFEDQATPYLYFQNNAGTQSLIAFNATAPYPFVTQDPTTTSGAALAIKAQSATGDGRTGGPGELLGGDATGDGGVGGAAIVASGQGTSTPDGGQGGPGAVLLNVGPNTVERLQQTANDFLAMGPGTVATSGYVRLPYNGTSTVNVLDVARSGTDERLIQLGNNRVWFGDVSGQVGNVFLIGATGGAVELADGVVGMGLKLGAMVSDGVSLWSIGGTSRFVVSNTASGSDFVFTAPGSGGATRVAVLAGDPTTNAPLQMGVSAAVSINGTCPCNLTLTPAQYANHTIQFTGTQTGAAVINVIMPAIVGGASGYCLDLDFTQVNLTGHTGQLAFWVPNLSGASVAASNPAALGTYLFCWDGTTPRISLIPKG